MSWKDSSSDLWYTTCWMADYVTSAVQYRLFPFLSIPDTVSSDIGPAYPPLPILLIFWHCDISPLFSCLHHSYESCSFRSSGGWNIQNVFISEAILRHLVPHGQFVTMWNARRCPWGWPLATALPDTRGEKKKETQRGRGRERGAEGEWTWQRPWNRSVPLSRARGVCSQAVSTSH